MGYMTACSCDRIELLIARLASFHSTYSDASEGTCCHVRSQREVLRKTFISSLGSEWHFSIVAL